MNTAAARIEPRIQDAHVTEDEIVARLADARVISLPLAWSWRLSEATRQQRESFRLIGSGQGIPWPDVDEDISVANLLAGQPSAESQGSFKKWLAGRSKPARRRKKS